MVLAAAVLTQELADLVNWLPTAADDTEAAKKANDIRKTPAEFFRGCLARGLENREYCAKGEGMHLLGRLQHAITPHIRWSENERLRRSLTDAKPLTTDT